MTNKAIPEPDIEANEKNTVKNSILGELIMSDDHCEKCKAPYKKTWTTCVKCNNPLHEVHKEEPKPEPEPTKTGYVCEKCKYPVTVDSDKCPKCGCTTAVKV